MARELTVGASLTLTDGVLNVPQSVGTLVLDNSQGLVSGDVVDVTWTADGQYLDIGISNPGWIWMRCLTSTAEIDVGIWGEGSGSAEDQWFCRVGYGQPTVFRLAPFAETGLALRSTNGNAKLEYVVYEEDAPLEEESSDSSPSSVSSQSSVSSLSSSKSSLSSVSSN